MASEKKKLRKWVPPRFSEARETYRLSCEVKQKIKLFTEKKLQLHFNQKCDKFWDEMLLVFNQELKHVGVQNVEGLRKVWIEEVLFFQPQRIYEGRLSDESKQVELLAYDDNLWAFYKAVSMCPNKMTQLALVWNQVSDKSLQLREFVKLSLQWNYELGSNMFTAAKMQQFCEFYSKISNVFFKKQAAAGQVDIHLIKTWEPIKPDALVQSNYPQLLTGIQFTIKCGGLNHALHTAAVTFLSRLVVMYGGLLTVDFLDTVEEVELWIIGIKDIPGAHKCTPSFLINSILNGKFSVDHKDHSKDQCLVPTRDNVLWVRKIPLLSCTGPAISSQDSDITNETALEIDKDVMDETIPLPPSFLALIRKESLKYMETSSPDLHSARFEVYYLFELIHQITENTSKKQTIERIWNAENCIHARCTQFSAIAEAWIKEDGPNAPKLPAYVFEKYCNLYLGSGMENAKQKVPIPFNFHEDSAFSGWYKSCIDRFLSSDIEETDQLKQQVKTFQNQSLRLQQKSDMNVWLDYQTTFLKNNFSSSFPSHNIPAHTGVFKSTIRRYLFEFNIYVPSGPSLFEYLLAKHYDYLITLYESKACVVRKGGLRPLMWGVLAGYRGGPWMLRNGQRDVFMGIYVNHCIVAGECDPWCSGFYSMDVSRRFRTIKMDREKCIIEACFQVANEVSTIRQLWKKLLENQNIKEFIEDHETFRLELYRNFRSYEGNPPAWTPKLLMHHAIVLFGWIDVAFPLLPLFQE